MSGYCERGFVVGFKQLIVSVCVRAHLVMCEFLVFHLYFPEIIWSVMNFLADNKTVSVVWLQIQRSRVRSGFFLRSSRSGTGSTQPREGN
jgi:hypothetical protein